MITVKVLILISLMISSVSTSNKFKQFSENRRTTFDSADSLVAHGSLDCAMACAHAQYCRSFFFNTRTGICQVHNQRFDQTDLEIEDEGTLYFQDELPEESTDPGLLMVPFLDETLSGFSILRNKTITDYPLPKTSNVLFLGFMEKHKRIIVAKEKPSQFDVFDITGFKMKTVKNMTFHSVAVDEKHSQLFFSPVGPAGLIGVMTTGFQNVTMNHVFKDGFTPRGLAVDPEAEVLYVVVVAGTASKILSLPYDFKKISMIKQTTTSYVIAFDPIKRDLYYSLHKDFMKNASSFMTSVKEVAFGSSIAFEYPKTLYVSGGGENYIRVVDTTMKETEKIHLPFNVSTSLAICFIN